MAAALLCSFACAGNSASSFDVHAAEGVLRRVLPKQAGQFELLALTTGSGAERFRISTANGHIRVEGTTISSILFGVNWYLKYVAQAQVSPNGDQLPPGSLPLPPRVIERETPYRYRYALNENI